MKKKISEEEKEKFNRGKFDVNIRSCLSYTEEEGRERERIERRVTVRLDRLGE
jgi:hypothetical protein